MLCFKLQRNGTENESYNIKDNPTERLQLQMRFLHQSIFISKAGPPSLKHDPAKYKDRVLDVSDSHRNIGTSCNSKLKLLKFKDLCIESLEKLHKDE